MNCGAIPNSSDRKRINPMRCWLIVGMMFACTLTGCVVGPDFQRPAPPQAKGYTSRPTTATAATTQIPDGEQQRFAEGNDIPGQWWALFHSKPLNDLIERALRTNHDIKAAQAALLIANENVLAQKGAFFPTVSADFAASRQKSSQAIAPIPNSNQFQFNLFTPQVSVSYMPDVFGLNRRTVESLQAQADETHFALAATQITLTSNIAAAAIQEASLRGQIAATRQLIDINTRILKILRAQYTNGQASRLDVAAQESQLAQVLSTLPPLQKQLEQQRDLLTVLAGGYPDSELVETFELASLELPGELPLSLPSQLVEQRPDVRQAEENLHSASAQIGVAVANRLPNLTLTASAGDMALQAGKLFTPGVGFWTIGGSVAGTLLDGGTLLHRERAARAAFVQAQEQYRSTVLAAFQNVADTLCALRNDADALKPAVDAEAAARLTLGLIKKQLESGYISYLSLLNAEQTYQQALINLVQARANRYADTVALFQALGGGWWNSELSK